MRKRGAPRPRSGTRGRRAVRRAPGWRLQDRAITIYQEALALLDENLRVSERLVAAGTATPDAVARSRAERSEAAQRLLEAERERADAARSLNELLRRPLDTPAPALPDSVVATAPVLDSVAALEAARAQHQSAASAALARSAGVDQSAVRIARALIGSLPPATCWHTGSSTPSTRPVAVAAPEGWHEEVLPGAEGSPDRGAVRVYSCRATPVAVLRRFIEERLGIESPGVPLVSRASAPSQYSGFFNLSGSIRGRSGIPIGLRCAFVVPAAAITA